MRYIRYKWLFSFCIVLAIEFLLIRGALLFPETQNDFLTGFKEIRNFTTDNYQANSQNWMIKQNKKNHIIYVANQAALLEYDGVTWRGYPEYSGIRTFPGVTVKAIDIDDCGKVYIGGINEAGYMSPDETGTLQYQSIIKYVPTNPVQPGEIYQVLCLPNGVWFRSRTALFHWNGTKIDIFKQDEFKTIFPWNNHLYAQQKGKLLILDNTNTFREVLSSPDLTYKIYVVAPYGEKNQELLFGIWNAGFFRFNGKELLPFPTEVDEYIKKNNLYHGIRISDGNYALATTKGGLVIMNPEGKWIGTIDMSSGLQNESIRYIMEDSTGNLWLALDNGMSRIDYGSPLSSFDSRSKLKGLILSIVRHKDTLYVGTMSGLYSFEKDPVENRFVFHPVKEINGECRNLLSLEDSLLVGSNNGIFVIQDKPGPPRLITPEKFPISILGQSHKYSNLVWAATDNEKYIFTLQKKDNKWVTTPIPMNGVNPFKPASLVEDENGNLWMSGNDNNLTIHILLNASFQNPILKSYIINPSISDDLVYIDHAAGGLLFATRKGFYSYNPSLDRFEPFQKFEIKQKDYNKADIFRFVEDRKKNIWFHSEKKNYLAIPNNKKRTYTITTTPFERFPYSQANIIYLDGELTWFGCQDKLICYNSSRQKDYTLSFPSIIRKITTPPGKRIIFDGSVPDSLTKQFPHILEYKERNLSFEVAAPFYDDESKTTYEYFLKGYDETWSQPTTDSKRNYLNLPEGNYIFKVRASNLFRTYSSEGVFSFRIKPPFYLTWWAYLIYIALAAVMVFLIVKWRSQKLEKEKKHLEKIIEERTQTIHQANERLKEMDKIKSRFFANISHEFRTPLTLIMGPIEHIKSECESVGLSKQMDMILRNARRLLGLINQLLDLSKFESGKMKLNAVQKDLVHFIKCIIEPFQTIAAQNRLKLTFYTRTESLPLYFDPEKLEKIVFNLLSNGVKFTPPGGSVLVAVGVVEKTSGASPGKRQAFISVKDTGCGIPGDQLVHLFDRFYQADITVEHHRKGSGIGLALTKELVAIHHGQITVNSTTGDNSGTEFIVYLPLGKEHLPIDEISKKSIPDPVEEDDHWKSEIETLKAIESPEEKPQSQEEQLNPEKNIILVVEDNSDLRFYIRSSLEPFYSVIEAKDGREGIETAKAVIPDLIISDIMMPETDGYELCRTIKKDIATSHIPVILLTAKASDEDILHGLKTGADDYITKPFNPTLLCARIKNLIELRHQFQHNIKREMVNQPTRISLSEIDKEFFNDLQKVIEANISNSDLNVEDLSKRLYMSRTTLYRKILALSGETPTDFIRSYRLKKAAQLLQNKFGSITEVAFEVGFNSRAYFTKCFKEKFNRLPSDYE